jgi:hypothetical protein
MAEFTFLPVTQYQPTFLPEEYDRNVVMQELWRISSVLYALAQGHLDKAHAVPASPYDGMVRYADGTDWDPGSGEGVYAYYNSTWNKL